jgi:dihydroxy-acid dehydratase
MISPKLLRIEMEAYNGGAIGAIKDGDIVEIDIPNRKLNVNLSDAEIEERLKKVKAPERKLTPLMVSYREKFTGSNCYGENVGGVK